jgi:ATP-binding cassette subfamily G (WHITE) protein 2 (SNQ2)
LLLKLLDLKHVENTLVGNDLVRGISGGQRKRVTIGKSLTYSASHMIYCPTGVAMMAGASLMILDEVHRSNRISADSN